MSDRDSIIERIRKLLALSENNPNEHEAVSAALKAQKLIAEYDVQELEITGEECRRVPVQVQGDYYVGKRWCIYLANAVAKNFRCRAYRHNERRMRRGSAHVIRFVGFELDAKAALLTYNMLVEVGEHLAREEAARYRRLYGSSQGVKNTFLFGFVKGVCAELEKQSQALMLVVPSEVNDYYSTLGVKRSAKQTYYYVYDAKDAGFEAGRDAVRSRRMESPKDHYLAAPASS